MRNLSQPEIGSLINNGCVAEDWTQILVSESFSTEHISNVRFSGRITLGTFAGTFELKGGLKQHAGLHNVTLHNCEIGSDVFIENVANYIANYKIASKCYIQNVDLLLVDKKTSFGNGIRVNVLNETGGREVPMFDKLSSSLAYVLALYRHKKEAIAHLFQLIDAYSEEQSSTMGTIAEHTTIVNTGTIHNVKIGAYTTIRNCSKLETGTITSCQEDPVTIGDNVIATEFIISAGAVVSTGARLIRTFIGQATNVSLNFSAHDSLIFSNGVFENGEACAIFAGPFTVTMHKSSLLIAGMFSFLNAGSGSNQSNHMYKLGPIHQGIVERGSKTTSDSYILWPARVGMFSLIMGRHYHHSDTTDMPFSYLIEHSNETYLVPGVNLKSVGTVRDAQKWPKRDKRKTTERLDYINFNLLSPYAIQKMLKGKEILCALRKMSGETSDIYSYRNTKIRNSSLHNGIKLYDTAIVKFLGNSLISRLGNSQHPYENITQIREVLKISNPIGEGQWVDLSGLFMPKSELDIMIEAMEKKAISLDEIHHTFETMFLNYYDMEWTWAYKILESYFNISIAEITIEQIKNIIEQWTESVVNLDKTLYKDAEKEFSITSMIGFGMDGTEMEKIEDFESVRGAFNTDPFVTSVKEHIESKKALANSILKLLPQ